MSTARHIYQGHCPDDLQPEARDPDCPACDVLVRAEVEAGVPAPDPRDTEITRLRQALVEADRVARWTDANQDAWVAAEERADKAEAEVARLTAALEAAQRGGGWRVVTEEEPPIGVRVVVTWPDGGYAESTREKTWWRSADGVGAFVDDPEFWQPLPERPGAVPADADKEKL